MYPALEMGNNELLTCPILRVSSLGLSRNTVSPGLQPLTRPSILTRTPNGCVPYRDAPCLVPCKGNFPGSKSKRSKLEKLQGRYKKKNTGES